MAQRTVVICDGEYIGIESIYMVINGHQINIPDRLKNLREKSRNNKLFCPCGCGANLILVAGDKNLREQHFRIKDGTYNNNCTFKTEGRESVEAKISLKCWLDDKLDTLDIETRVPIYAIENNKKTMSFIFYLKKEKLLSAIVMIEEISGYKIQRMADVSEYLYNDSEQPRGLALPEYNRAVDYFSFVPRRWGYLTEPNLTSIEFDFLRNMIVGVEL